MNNSTPSNSINDIAQALFVVNRHAKTAPDPRHLYTLKKKTIQQLLHRNQAKKLGLHYSDHPKLSHQHSTLLVQVADYCFHIPPKKEDFQNLKHLGNVDHAYRNPKPNLSLSRAKKILYKYLDWKEEPSPTKPSYRKPMSTSQSSAFSSPWGQLTTWDQNRKRKR